MNDVYEKAKLRGAALQRKRWVRLSFEISAYTLLILIIYFGLIGMPLWKGGVWWLYWVVSHKFVIQGGWAILIGLAFLYVSDGFRQQSNDCHTNNRSTDMHFALF